MLEVFLVDFRRDKAKREATKKRLKSVVELPN